MQRLGKRQQVDLETISLNDDGELNDRVFCLHCHTINRAEAEICRSCKQSLIELASDLRNRLERIQAHQGYPVLDERHNDSVQRSERPFPRAFERLKRTVFWPFIARFLQSAENAPLIGAESSRDGLPWPASLSMLIGGKVAVALIAVAALFLIDQSRVLNIPPIPVFPRTVAGEGSAVLTSSTIGLSTTSGEATGVDFDLLDSLPNIESDKITWDQNLFGSEGDDWQLGTATAKSPFVPQVVRIGPGILTSLFGTDTARHLTKLQATIELDSWDPALLPRGLVYFGVGFETLQGYWTSEQISLVHEKIFSLGINMNGIFRMITTLPVTPITITVQRDNSGVLSFYINGALLPGNSGPAFPLDSPVNIYLYTSARGVVAKVKSLSIHLD